MSVTGGQGKTRLEAWVREGRGWRKRLGRDQREKGKRIRKRKGRERCYGCDKTQRISVNGRRRRRVGRVRYAPVRSTISSTIRQGRYRRNYSRMYMNAGKPWRNRDRHRRRRGRLEGRVRKGRGNRDRLGRCGWRGRRRIRKGKGRRRCCDRDRDRREELTTRCYNIPITGYSRSLRKSRRERRRGGKGKGC